MLSTLDKKEKEFRSQKGTNSKGVVVAMLILQRLSQTHTGCQARETKECWQWDDEDSEKKKHRRWVPLFAEWKDSLQIE